MAYTHESPRPAYRRGGKPEEGLPLPPQERQNRIQALKKEMRKHEGEFVLMVVRYWERLGRDMPEGQTPYGLDEVYCLGIIAPPYLQVENQEIIVGMKEHVMFNPHRSYSGIKRNEGPPRFFLLGTAWETDLGRFSHLEPDGLTHNKELLEIIVGDQNVATWVEKEAAEGRIPSHLLELKEKSPEFFNKVKERQFDTNLINIFQRMHMALGKELLLSEETTQKLNGELNKIKVNVLTAIDELLQQEDQLKGRIRNIFDFVKKGGGILPVDGGITVVEDEDDAKVATWDLQEKSAEIRRNIKSKLGRALELGMHETERTIEVEIRPGHKEVLDVRRFIRGLCENYEIPLSTNSSQRNKV